MGQAFQYSGSSAYYGVIIGIGMLVGILMAVREAKRTKQNVNDYMDLALFGIIFAIIDAPTLLCDF